MSEKSIVQEARDIQLAMELITLGARLQMLESETQLSRGRLIKLYKELRGSPPPKGMLPFSNCCGGNFITHAHQPVGSFACSLCQPPSRAVKRRKLSQNPADIIPQLLDEQRVQAV
ncbi:TPA: FlhC family transcriptional regulator [Escherichia coli]